MCLIGKMDVRDRKTNEFSGKTLLHMKSSCDIIKCRFNIIVRSLAEWLQI